MVLKIFLFTVILSSLTNIQNINTEILYRLWIQSSEEQTDDILVYRPAGYELPKVWGREKMEFNKSGEYIYYQIAPDDGYLTLKGTFELDNENNELHITYLKDKHQIETDYKLIDITCNILKLKLLNYKVLQE